MPSWRSSSEILVVVRRDQRKPVMGSPAVSCSSKQCRSRLCPAFFFCGLTAATLAACPATDHVPVQQLLTASGDRMRVQAEKIAEQGVAAVAEADGFQAGKQAALLFVEQPIEQDDSGVEFVERDLQVGRVNSQRNSLGAAAGHGLMAAIGHLDGGIEKLAAHFGPAQTILLDQMA